MISLMKSGGRVPLNVLALALGTWVCSGPSAAADGEPCVATGHAPKDVKRGCVDRHQHARTLGTLGYGPPGLFAGFQGFGLGYHRGYGYGGDALGSGAEGGCPLYGGPGYPHCEPVLRRCGGITPFPHFAGPGYPSPEYPHFYGGIDQVVPEKPVITIGDDRSDTGYGSFTGAIPYPESFLAPFTSAAAAEGSTGGAGAHAPSAPSANPAPGMAVNASLIASIRPLGIDGEPVVEAGGVRGLKVSKVYPGTAAEKAGLHAGDVILSTNGYNTEQPGNLAWIIAHAAPDHVLKMNVRTASDGQEHAITAPLPD